VLVSHAHADHLSFTTLAALPVGMPILAPPPVAQWLIRAGHRTARPIGAGEQVTIGGVTVHGAMADHRGTRYGFDQWRSAANMYLLEGPRSTCFFAGDTGLTNATHHLVERTLHSAGRELDIALLPIGYAPWWKPMFRRGHLTSDDALTLFGRLRARYLIPYHWGTFHHLTAGPYDAMIRLRAALASHPRRDDVKVLEPGMSFTL
jgi:L-ascorbate metabolism protein UlaG (beta-lactamase superfamily)